MLYEYSVKELKDHKDKREVFIGNDGVSQIIESTALFIVRETRINTVFYNCDANDSLFKTFTKDGNTKQCKNETLVNFCVQLLQFIDLTGVLEKVQLDNNEQNPPQQTENSKPDELKKELHNHIFKGNAFEVWQSMFDEFEINEKSRTDVKFMFEEMKKEGLIHKTVNQTTFLEWITSTYNGLIVEKTSNHSRTKHRLQAYSRAKELYKE